MSPRIASQPKQAPALAVSPRVRATVRAPGRPLDSATRSFMETRFGEPAAQTRAPAAAAHEPAAEAEANRVAQAVATAPRAHRTSRPVDFGTVRIHDEADAAESARAEHASAYALGDDLVFARGRYQPATPAGRNLLAHELAHILQQRESGLERVQKKDETESPTATSETVATIFPFVKDTKVKLSAVFSDARFGFAPNAITTWIRGVQDQELTVTEASADRFSAKVQGVVQRRGPGLGPAAPGIPNVRITVERIGGGRFQITITSDGKVLAAQEARATRSAQGTIVLTPVPTKLAGLPSADKPLSKGDEYAKSDAAPLPGLEGPSKAEQDKATTDALMKPPAAEAAPAPVAPPSASATTPGPAPATGLSKEDEETLTKGGENFAKAYFKTPEGKRLADAASKAAEKLPTIVVVAAPLTLVAAAFAGMVATKSESPIKESPDIPLSKIGDVEMKAKVTFKGPADKPTEASLTLTFAKGSLEVAAAFKRTWTDPATPASAQNQPATEAGLSVKIPLGKDPAAPVEPTDTEKTRAEIDRLREQEQSFKKGLRFKPGSAEAKAQELEKKAADAAARKQFQPGLTGSAGAGPHVLQTFDPRPGPGKTPWNLDQLSKLIGAAFASSPGATLHVVVTYATVPGDTIEARRVNTATHDTAVSDADTIKSALEQWLPPTKGRIQTSVEFKHGGRTFGLSSDDLELLGARGAAVLLIPGAASK